jgi:hypothetical protein
LLKSRCAHHWLVLAIIGLWPASTCADEVMTRNGDRLTGDIVTMEDNVLTLDTEYGRHCLCRRRLHERTSDRNASTHLGYRLEFTLFSRLKFFQRFDGYYDLRYGNAIRITSDQGVRIPVYQTLYVSLEYDYRLNTQPAPGRVKVDDSYIFGVGFEF